MEKLKTKISWHHLFLQAIVVFLGVTVAFLLNNWASNRHEKKLVKLYKQALLEDVSTNINELKRAVKNDSLWIKSTGNLLDYLDEHQSAVVDSLQIIFDRTRYAHRVNPQKATYHSMEASGQLNLLSDFNLKKEIVKYYNGSVVKVEYAENYLWNFINSEVIPHALISYNRHEKEFLNPQRDAVRYLNNLITVHIAKEQILFYYRELLSHSEYLKSELERNIDES
ncbi:hypothetical protein [Maribacter sp. 2308TA10-17]|uniref:hypothetical protein n=1 Tax=Maribacter sp. 2308TA10-17 TaxID=3386276 RepID=UPI0039BD08D3